MAAKTIDEYLATCIHDEYYHSLIREGWNAAIESIAARSTSDNTKMDAIALCKKIIRLANGATILGYGESTVIINGAHAVLAQQHRTPLCSACGVELSCRNHCHDTNSPHGIVVI